MRAVPALAPHDEIGRYWFDDAGAEALGRKYDPDYHNLPTVLFAAEESVSRARSRSLGWARLHRGPLEVLVVPGDHQTMLVAPNVDGLGEAVGERLRVLRS